MPVSQIFSLKMNWKTIAKSPGCVNHSILCFIFRMDRFIRWKKECYLVFYSDL